MGNVNDCCDMMSKDNERNVDFNEINETKSKNFYIPGTRKLSDNSINPKYKSTVSFGDSLIQKSYSSNPYPNSHTPNP